MFGNEPLMMPNISNALALAYNRLSPKGFENRTSIQTFIPYLTPLGDEFSNILS